MRGTVGNAISHAYASRDPRRARRSLKHLAWSLEREHPGPAASLRQGLASVNSITAGLIV
jgi:hypothetical protein